MRPATRRTTRSAYTWIAATALVNEAEVWTQDRDFSDFAASVRVVHI